MSIRGLIATSVLLLCATHVFAQQWCVSVANTSFFSEVAFPTYITDPPEPPTVPSTYHVRFFKKPGTVQWTHDPLPKQSIEAWLAANTIFKALPASDSLKVTCTYHISKPTESLEIDGLHGGTCFETPGPAKPNEVVTKEEDEWIAVEKEPSFDYSELQHAVHYPDLARRIDVQGIVLVGVLISETGAIRKVKIIESETPHLNDAAVKAILSTTFTPAYQNSKPISCWVRIPLNFRLR